MPRARISDANEDIVLSKPRTRKPRVVSSDEAMAPAPRKRAVSRPRVTEERVSESVLRKAPTPIAARRRTQSRNSKALFGVIGVGVVISGLGIGIGFMDSGSIDVVAVVNERNEKISKGEVRDELGNAVTQTIQVQTDTRPNGGLPMGDVIDVPATPPEVSTTTQATTTNQTATSTESGDTEATTTPDTL